MLARRTNQHISWGYPLIGETNTHIGGTSTLFPLSYLLSAQTNALVIPSERAGRARSEGPAFLRPGPAGAKSLP